MDQQFYQMSDEFAIWNMSVEFLDQDEWKGQEST